MKVHARHHVQRIKDRARYDRETAYAILDSTFLGHVGFCVDNQPFVIPMLYARAGDSLLLHGSIASRLLKTVGEGIQACVSVAAIDGLVLARSHFHHSVNYRSVVAFGKARELTDKSAKTAALAHFVEALLPGRAIESRAPDRNELAATSVLQFDIIDISAKIRASGAKDDKADLRLPWWAGVVPMHNAYDTPIASDDCDVAVPESVKRLLNLCRASQGSA
ncbi:MAG TPA: pyridoxamine 5'-phosphate oxidase family protein [Rudaea sp.]|nr:pyridoxamine 5'-phosphate oxidase family protein [Rudaea sp.]